MSEKSISPQDLVEVIEITEKKRRIVVASVEEVLGSDAALYFGEYCHHIEDGREYHRVLAEDYNQKFIAIAGFSTSDVLAAIEAKEKELKIPRAPLPKPTDRLP